MNCQHTINHHIHRCSKCGKTKREISGLKRGGHPDDFAIRTWDEVSEELAKRGMKFSAQTCRTVGNAAMEKVFRALAGGGSL